MKRELRKQDVVTACLFGGALGVGVAGAELFSGGAGSASLILGSLSLAAGLLLWTSRVQMAPAAPPPSDPPDFGPAASQALQQGRLAQMAVLAGGVAHEINNPLASILGNLHYVDTGLDEDESREQLKEALKDAEAAAQRIRSIVEDIRSFAKSDDSDHLELVQLDEAARTSVRLLRYEFRTRVELKLESRPSPRVFANPSRLAQALVNLLVNAIQAIPADRDLPHGQVTLRTGTTAEGEAFVEVEDNGVGIPEEIRRRVFEPFFTTRPVGQGTGLGLAICHGFVRRLGGRMSVRSEPGHGSTFRIQLPNGESLLAAAGSVSHA
ncbi:MAG: HAMP domain-containing sensor histidine kinase [Myxococcota bacterium]